MQALQKTQMQASLESLPVVGSSRYRTLGLPSKAIARLSLLRMPPLYAPALTPLAPVSFTCENHALT